MVRNTKRYQLHIAVIAVIVTLLVTVTANAFVAWGFKWWPDTIIYYDQHSLNSNWRPAVWRGAVQWNNVSPSNFQWRASNGGANDVYKTSIDGKYGVLAETSVWHSGAIIVSMSIRFDDDDKWYKGTGSPPSSRADVWGVAAHEFGHALGLGHTNQGCGVGSGPTMCAYTNYGESNKRSLETDDRNGINAIYPNPYKPSKSDAEHVEIGFSYTGASFEDRIERSNLIFAGTVMNMSPTQWNQDSGEYWEEEVDGTVYTALPFYTVEVSVDKLTVADSSIGKSRGVILTILGANPLTSKEDAVTKRGPVFNSLNADVPDLQVGDEIIVFARKTELAWRDGKRPIWQLIGLPTESYLLKGDDGLYRFQNSPTKGEGVLSLETLMAQIAQKRQVIEQ
jgi:hypothetical protein